MVIVLTERQFGHLMGHVERNGWGKLIRGLSVEFINMDRQSKIGINANGYDWTYTTANIEYIVTIDARLTADQWIELIQRIRDI